MKVQEIYVPAEIMLMLKNLHASYLRDNEYDEGDLLFYRINYRLAEAFGITIYEAEQLHSLYHKDAPRRVSEGYCDTCRKVVTFIPIIYGIQSSDMPKMRAAEKEGRLIVGDMESVRQGSRAAMFGCKICKTNLPKYGVL